MSKNKDKTNVMRILDQKKITYISHNYESTGAISGVEVAQALTLAVQALEEDQHEDRREDHLDPVGL